MSAKIPVSGWAVPEALAGARQHLRAGELGKAEELCLAILAAEPDHVEGHVALGRTLAAKGELAEARRRFERAIALAPTFAQAHYHLGNLLDELGLAPESVSCYRRAIALDPNFTAARHALWHSSAFFRDPEVFETLQRRIRRHLDAAGAAGSESFRIWVPGCSRGQEAYSFAILLRELSAELPVLPPSQVIGTDVAGNLVKHARAGRYQGRPPSTVSEKRLERFFVATDDGYQIADAIRDMCIFHRHDLIKDPAVAEVDVISCRNVLGFFFEAEFRDRIIRAFYAALKPNGCLVLGKREALVVPDELFEPVDRGLMIFTKKADGVRA